MATIRPAEPDDLESIRAIYNHAVMNTTATFDTEPQSAEAAGRWFREHDERLAILVAVDAGDVAGWASLSRWSPRRAYDGTVEISVYVAPSHHGRGIGQALVAAIVGHGRRAGFHTIVARIAGESEASIHIHRKAGFAEMGVMREAGWKFERYVDVHFLQLMLQ